MVELCVSLEEAQDIASGEKRSTEITGVIGLLPESTRRVGREDDAAE